MARPGRKEEQLSPEQQQVSPCGQVLRRSFWAYRQLDMFQEEQTAKALNPYARHLQRMRAMREQQA